MCEDFLPTSFVSFVIDIPFPYFCIFIFVFRCSFRFSNLVFLYCMCILFMCECMRVYAKPKKVDLAKNIQSTLFLDIECYLKEVRYILVPTL